MFQRLLSSLSATPRRAPTPSGRLALAALLVRLARADGDYSPAEVARIDAYLAAHYQLSPFEAVALRQEAEKLEAEAPDTVRFTRAVKEAVPHEDRMEVMGALWSIALADQERSADEEALIRLIASLLGISDRDSAIARQRVIAGREA